MAMEDSNGWQTVSNPKRNRKQAKPPSHSAAGAAANGVPDVFLSVELHSKDRIRALSAAAAAQNLPPDEEIRDLSSEDPDDVAGAAEDVKKEVKKAKQKKPKQPKISVPEAASKMDASDLAAHLAELSENYGEDLQLMRFGDYFGRAFSAVGSAQFPWVKMFRESPVAKMADVPISHVKDDVLKTSVAWLRKKSPDALATFLLSSLDSILDDLSIHLGTTAKGTKKPAHAAPSKSQVAVFIVVAMALRGKPEVLINILPILRENTKYQGQEKLPLIIWMATQASQGDLTVGMYVWANYLLPVLSTKSGNNPLNRDLVLQSVERILSFPKARPVLLNGAVRKGERLVPPQALELVMGFTFPAPSDRVKATERFEAIYPTLKEIALTGTGGKGMKLVVQQIAGITLKAASEGGDDLSAEAAKIFLWCLDENQDSYSHWDKLYMDNLKGSVIIMRKLSDEWKSHAQKATDDSLQILRKTLGNFIQKNEKALETEKDAARALLKEANECCKVLLSKAKKGKGYIKALLLLTVCGAVGAAVVSQNIEDWDMQKISEKVGDLKDWEWDMDELHRMIAKVAKMLNLPVTD